MSKVCSYFGNLHAFSSGSVRFILRVLRFFLEFRVLRASVFVFDSTGNRRGTCQVHMQSLELQRGEGRGGG